MVELRDSLENHAECPICGTELLVYSSEGYRLYDHLMLEHLDDMMAKQTPIGRVKCVCGTIFRGMRSLAQHLSTMPEDEIKEHQTLWMMADGAKVDMLAPNRRPEPRRFNSIEATP